MLMLIFKVSRLSQSFAATVNNHPHYHGPGMTFSGAVQIKLPYDALRIISYRGLCSGVGVVILVLKL